MSQWLTCLSIHPSFHLSVPLSAQSLHPSIYQAPSPNPLILPSPLIPSVYVFLPFSLAPGFIPLYFLGPTRAASFSFLEEKGREQQESEGRALLQTTCLLCAQHSLSWQ